MSLRKSNANLRAKPVFWTSKSVLQSGNKMLSYRRETALQGAL